MCGQNNKTVLIRTQDRRFNVRTKGCNYDLVKCSKCGFIYLDFIPKNRKDFMVNYPVSYWQTSKTSVFLLQVQKVLVWMKYKRTLSSKKVKRRLLDVGCGAAEFTGYCQKKGWEVYGQDVSKDACNEAKKRIKNVFCGRLSEANYPHKYFDVVFLNSVLHQMEKPIEELKTIRELLTKDGEVIISVPDISSWQFTLSKNNWFYLDSPRHLHYFQKNSLSDLLYKSGFVVQRLDYPPEEFPLDIFHSFKPFIPKALWSLWLPLSLLLKTIPKFRGNMEVVALTAKKT